MVATVVYGMIGAKPCLSAHCEAMRRLTGNDDIGPDFVKRWPDYPIDAQARALLHYARLLTGSPDRITDRDVESLRDAGWNDRAIYEATALVGLLNFIGRMEAASGLPMEEIPAGADLPEARPDGRPSGRMSRV
jgi:alkylhydroperoxidase family enzyme